MSKIEEMLKNEKVEWKKLGEVCDIVGGSSFPKSFQGKAAGKYAFYKVADMNKVNVFMDKSDNYIDEDDREYLKAKLITKNAVIFPKVGATLLTNKKRILKEDAFIDNNIYALVAKGVNYKYLYYVFSNEELMSFANGYGAVPSIDVDRLKKYEIPIPSIKTQEKIVKTLDKFTEYVTELQAELQAELQYRTNQYEYYRNMLLSEEYLNKLSKKLLDVSEGENRLYCSNPEYMRELIEVKLETIVKIKNGKDWKKLGKGNIPVYGSGGNMDIYVDKYSYDKPSVLIPRKGSIENVFYLEEPFWNVDTIFYTEIDESKVIPRYLYYFISNYDMKSLSTDSTRPSLTQEVLNRIVVQLPPLSLQNKIVEILDKFQAILSETRGLLPKEIEERQKQYEYYREKLLTFDIESGTHARN